MTLKKGLTASLFILGLSSIITQVIVLREMTVSFYGNEFFMGVVLASWLFWVAIGSKLGEKLKELSNSKFLISLPVLVWLLFFFEIFLIRLSKAWLGFAGEIPNLIFALFCAWLFPLPICLLLGFWWTGTTRIFCRYSPTPEARTVNRAYLIETLGFILGGILFSFLLVHIPGSLIIPESLRFKNQELIESINSPYGNIAVTKTDSQYNFYESGLLLGSTENIEFAEQLVHLSLLQHPSPKKVLLIGGGFNGGLNEILKHQPEKIYYVELDRELIALSSKYIPQEFKEALDNPKVEVITTDARYFLARTQERFDAIICNLPDPSTALINRFYTKEFFEKAKEKLGPNGIFATYLTFSPSTPGKNLENLNASIFKTLKKVFNQVIVLPEEENFFLASNNQILTYQPETLLQRFREREIKTQFITPSYITYRLSNDRIEKTLNLFEKNQEAKENKDFGPIAYFYNILFWLDHFYPAFSNFFKNLASAFWLIFVAVLILLTTAEVQLRQLRKKSLPLFSVAVAGFSLMALETLIIFSYQTAVGFLYHRIALLIAALMAGMALGVWYGNKNIQKTKSRPGEKQQEKSLFKLHLLLIIFCVVLPWGLPLAKEVIFLILAIIAGFLGASVFPLANQIYLSSQPDPPKKTGVIYSADLIGSCWGALLPALILIPVFGVWQTLIFIGLANLWIFLILAINSRD